MCNEDWMDLFPNAVVSFLPEGNFDHTLAVISLTGETHKGKTPFRYYNRWRDTDGFSKQVAREWQIPINGNTMYQLVMKLKRLKKTLKSIRRSNHANIEIEDREAELLMKQYQQELNTNPTDMGLREKERQAVLNYNSVHKTYFSHLSQKAKAH